MKIVVIGGSGHVGTYLVPMLVEAGHQVVNVSRGKAAPYIPHPAWERVKWAYQLGLLDVAAGADTNHPRLLFMDEPRQQEAAEVSVARLFSEAANVAQRGAQILIATSERLASVEEALLGKACQLIKFDGRMIKRL